MKRLFAIFLIIVLFLSGCDINNTKTNKSSPKILYLPYLKQKRISMKEGITK